LTSLTYSSGAFRSRSGPDFIFDRNPGKLPPDNPHGSFSRLRSQAGIEEISFG
jgi:hypothetical protein